MIILEDRKLIEARSGGEQEIEELVFANYERFFGPSSVLIPKARIKTKDGFATIPDGFAIDLAARVWYVVEAELGYHSVWTHIAPQVTKQLLAAARPETRQLLTEIVVHMVMDDPMVKERFEDEGMSAIDIRKVLGEILERPPIIGMPIDSVSTDLREWSETLRNDVRPWVVWKYVQFAMPSVVAYEIPEKYRPALDTTGRESKSKSGIRTYDVSLGDLAEAGLLSANDELQLGDRPRGGKRRIYKGVLAADASITVLNESFSSPSYAALLCIQDAGSERTTVNGWTSWRTKDGRYLAQIRSEYLESKESEAEQAIAVES